MPNLASIENQPEDQKQEAFVQWLRPEKGLSTFSGTE